MKTFWLELLGIPPALRATPRLSRRLCIPGATRAIGLFNACLRPSSIAIASASYTSLVFPNEIPCFLCQLPTQFSTHPFPVPVGVSFWSTSCDPSVYTIMSSGFRLLSQPLNFVAAFSLLVGQLDGIMGKSRDFRSRNNILNNINPTSRLSAPSTSTWSVCLLSFLHSFGRSIRRSIRQSTYGRSIDHTV